MLMLDSSNCMLARSDPTQPWSALCELLSMFTSSYEQCVLSQYIQSRLISIPRSMLTRIAHVKSNPTNSRRSFSDSAKLGLLPNPPSESFDFAIRIERYLFTAQTSTHLSTDNSQRVPSDTMPSLLGKKFPAPVGEWPTNTSGRGRD